MEKYIGREYEEKEMPYTGGKFISKENIGAEEWNFLDVNGNCYGYVETKFNKNRKNTLHIERIDSSFRNSNEIKNVLVVWVSKNKYGKQKIVGWYKNATVYREHQVDPIRCQFNNYSYNVIAKANDCTLLPIEERKFEVPVVNKKEGIEFGFGQSNVWYANENNAKEFVNSVVNYIENYNGKKLNKIYTEEELEEIVEINNEDIDNILNQIDSHIFENDSEHTYYEDNLKYLKLCNSILKINPMNEYAYLYRLILLILLYRIKKVINEYKTNLDLFKDDELKFEAEYMLGWAYFLNNNIENSIEKLTDTANKYKRVETYLILGDIYEYLKNYDEAKSYYEKAIDIDNKNIEAYYKIAYIEYEVNNKENAINNLNKIIEIDNDNFDALYDKVCILSELGKTEDAIKIINEVLKTNNNDKRFIDLKKEMI